MKDKNQVSLLFAFVATMMITVLYSFRAHASEIDSFTLRFPPMRDATARVDQLTKELMLKAIDQANQKGSCDEANLYAVVRDVMGGGLFWSNLEGILSTDGHIDRRNVPRRDSIYGDIAPFTSIPIFFFSLGGTLQIGRHVIGTDKFGHFFQDGGTEFEKAFIEGRGIEEAVTYGEKQEEGLEGLAVTGVYSYADMVSNFKGMMFYRRLTNHYLEEGETPYVLCQENKWVLSQLPSWSTIIDGGMDEAINCNRYYNHDFESKVKSRIAQLEIKYRRPYQCPIDLNTCRQVKANLDKIYPQVYERLISPECLNLK